MTKKSDPFYVGYLSLPKQWKGTVIVFIALWLIGLGTFAVVLAAKQDKTVAGVWDTSTVREVEGLLRVDPYPVLYTGENAHKGVLLVSELKFGVGDRALPFDGQSVRVKGHFVGQESRAMYELVAGEDAIVSAPERSMSGTEQPTVRELGEHTLVGEISDSKCFLGVMKPGYGKTHRACAVRCLSGGITPIFVTRDAAGAATIYVLTGAENQAIGELLLPYVAEPVSLRGKVHARGDLLYFAIDTNAIERLEDSASAPQAKR